MQELRCPGCYLVHYYEHALLHSYAFFVCIKNLPLQRAYPVLYTIHAVHMYVTLNSGGTSCAFTSCYFLFFFWLFYFPFQAIKLWKKTCARLDGGAAGRLLTKYLNCLEMWKYLSRIMTILERALDQRCFRSCKILPRKHNLKVEMVTVVYCGWVRVNQLMLFFNGSSKQRVVFNLPLTTLLAGFVRSWVLHLLHLQQQDYSHHREFVSLVQMLPV